VAIEGAHLGIGEAIEAETSVLTTTTTSTSKTDARFTNLSAMKITEHGELNGQKVNITTDSTTTHIINKRRDPGATWVVNELLVHVINQTKKIPKMGKSCRHLIYYFCLKASPLENPSTLFHTGQLLKLFYFWRVSFLTKIYVLCPSCFVLFFFASKFFAHEEI
jgi:hypothetical protein